MNYHLIRTNDMLNGDGLRVVLFVSGCDQKCKGCHNPQTWDVNSGKLFDETALSEILTELKKDYISGLTISGGEPLKKENQRDVYNLIKTVKTIYPHKTIWLYTGYTLNINDFDTTSYYLFKDDIYRCMILAECDVVCDGEFIQSLADVNYPWVGSTNQRVIDVKKTLSTGEIVLKG